jgi:ADP-heptose:LPS heptosyltransferase
MIMSELASLHPDCRFFRGSIPCKPHKQHGVHCRACRYYDPIKERILIIKLGAIGDVIRSTPILHRLKAEYPQSEICWLTHSPAVIPGLVDHVFKFTPEDVVRVQQMEFDLVINLDKDAEACALANSVQARKKKGFVLRNNRPWPADEDAADKFLTGLFDDLSKANRKSYLKELFEICGYQFAGEKYILDHSPGLYQWPVDKSRPVIGLNTGCGGRWKSRLWAEKNWIELAQKLSTKEYHVLLLGGREEHEKNQRLASASGAAYLGHFPLDQFIDEMDQCDLIVTAVTMAMHLAIGLGKKLILFNNTFNRHEFELYGQGTILEPEFDCDCYYAAECPNDCMQYIYVDRVLAACEDLLR